MKNKLILLTVLLQIKLGCTQLQIPGCQLTGGVLSCTDANIRSSSSFGTQSVYSLELIRGSVNNLDFLKNSVFQATLNQIYFTEVGGLTSQHLNADVFRNINLNIQTLSIKKIPQVNSIDFLKDLPWVKLETLIVRECGLTTIDPGVFIRTAAARSIDLTSNNLISLDFSTIQQNYNLQTLRLSHNKLQSVIALNADRFYALHTLNLASNSLEVFDVDNLPTVMANIDLSGNRLERLELTPKTKQRLMKLNLANNQIRFVSPLQNTLANKLEELNLENNRALVLERNSFSGLTSLKSLVLTGCGLTEITEQLQGLTALSVLYMNNNMLSTLPINTFADTLSLTKLYLQNNILDNVDFVTSGDAPVLLKLAELNIAGNRLENLKNFAATPQLRILRMGSNINTNRFSELSRCTFSDLPRPLQIVCAQGVKAEDQCKYDSVLLLFKERYIQYNNEQCCENPDHKCCQQPLSAECVSNYPDTLCNTNIKQLCTVDPIDPTMTTTKSPGTGGSDSDRKPFSGLHVTEQVVMAIGFIIALLLLLLFLFCCLRKNRSYSNWLKDFNDPERQAGNRNTMQMSGAGLPDDDEDFDFVDGPSFNKGTLNSSRMREPTQSTLRSAHFNQKSMDTISMMSGMSSRSTASKQAFGGRNKFKESCFKPTPIIIDNGNFYGAGQSPRHRAHSISHNSSPTGSHYSYASISEFQRRNNPNQRLSAEFDMSNPAFGMPGMAGPPGRRRHRSGGSVMPSRAMPTITDQASPPPHSADDLLREILEEDMRIKSPDVPDIKMEREATVRRKQKEDDISPDSTLLTSKFRKTDPARYKKRASPTHRSPVNRYETSRALPKTPSNDNSINSLKSASSAGSTGSSCSFTKNNPGFKMDDQPSKNRRRRKAEVLPMEHYASGPLN